MVKRSSNLQKIKKKVIQSEPIVKEINPTQKKAFFESKTFYAVIVFFVAFLIYANTINHDYAIDDVIVTNQNPLVQKGVEGISEIISHGYFYANTGRNDESYRPLSMVIIALETEFFGLNPKVFHFFNVLYYSISCLLLFIFLKIIFRDYNILIAFFIALIFTVHPIHTEVVANIKSRDEILHFLSIISALILFLKYIDTRKVYFLIFSLLSYFLALISKENAVTFIAIFPLVLYFFRENNLKQIVLKVLPFFIVLILYFVLRMNILDTIAFKNEITLYQNSLVGAKNIFEYIATNLVIHLKYLFLLIFPYNLSWDYSYNQIPTVNFSNFKAIFSLLVFLAIGLYAIYGTIKKHNVAFGIVFYLITISIVSNFVVKIASTMGERFIFTSSLGFCIVLVFVFYKIFKRVKLRNIYLIYTLSIIGLLFSARTIIRNKDWKNDETIYNAGVLTSPNSARTHLALADIYRIKFLENPENPSALLLYQNAIEEFEKSLEIYPENTVGYYNFGYLYYMIGLKDKAMEKFTKGLDYDSTDIDLINYSGIIYTENGDFEKGKKSFEKVIEIDSSYVHAYNNLGYINNKLNDYETALKYYLKVLEKDSTYKSINTYIAEVYVNLKDYENALKYYKISFSKNPEKIEITNSIKKIEELLNKKDK